MHHIQKKKSVTVQKWPKWGRRALTSWMGQSVLAERKPKQCTSLPEPWPHLEYSCWRKRLLGNITGLSRNENFSYFSTSNQTSNPNPNITLTLTHSSSLLIHPTNTYYHWVIPKPDDRPLCSSWSRWYRREREGVRGASPQQGPVFVTPSSFPSQGNFSIYSFFAQQKRLLQKMLMFTKPHQGMGSAVLNILEPDPDEECVTIVQPRGDKVMDELLSSRTGGGD